MLNPLLGPQSLSAPYQSTTNSINTNPITGANLIGTDNTEYGIVTDNTAVMLAAKYTWDPFKFYAGYEHIQQFNPSNPLGVGASAQGGYLLSGVEDNNLDSPKLVQIAWTGVKYAYDSKTDITLSYYHQWQNDFRVPPACPPTAVSALPARASSTRFRCIRIITSPSVSTLMPALRIPTSAAVWPSPFLTAPASPITTTTTLLRQLVLVSPSDRFPRKSIRAARA